MTSFYDNNCNFKPFGYFYFYRHVGHVGWDPKGGFDVRIYPYYFAIYIHFLKAFVRII